MDINHHNKLNLLKLLYIAEEGVDHDYHIMPFELICERIHVTDIKDSWKNYLEIKPNIVMIHIISDYHFCEEIVDKIKKIDKDCVFLILASETLQDTLSNSTCKENAKLLFEPVRFETMETVVKELIDSMDVIYFMDEDLL